MEGVVVASNIRLSEAVESYLAMRRAKYAEATVTNEAFVLRRFVAWHGDVQLRHLRPERVEEWFVSLTRTHTTRDGRERPPIQATTWNFYRTTLASLSRFCIQRDYIRRDLLVHVEALKTESKIRQRPAPHLLVEMLDKAGNAMERAFLATAINTAARRSELVRLRLKDLDLDAGCLMLTITKTRQSDEFPVSSDLDGELRRWLIRYEADLSRSLRAEDHLFPARTGPRYTYSKDGDGKTVQHLVPSQWKPARSVGPNGRGRPGAAGEGGW